MVSLSFLLLPFPHLSDADQLSDLMNIYCVCCIHLSVGCFFFKCTEHLQNISQFFSNFPTSCFLCTPGNFNQTGVKVVLIKNDVREVLNFSRTNITFFFLDTVSDWTLFFSSWHQFTVLETRFTTSAPKNTVDCWRAQTKTILLENQTQ